ncbi:MAG: hypothetical protein Q7R83_02585, partial [bacterium]|nr:hypothetical protein [bacterium]
MMKLWPVLVLCAVSLIAPAGAIAENVKTPPVAQYAVRLNNFFLNVGTDKIGTGGNLVDVWNAIQLNPTDPQLDPLRAVVRQAAERILPLNAQSSSEFARAMVDPDFDTSRLI